MCIILFLVFYTLAINWHPFTESLGYLYEGLTYSPRSEHPVDPQGQFGLIHDLVKMSSVERMDYIAHFLAAEEVPFEPIPVADGQANLFVPGDISGGFTVLTAHYDKSSEDPDYQGALDNTASVAVLLRLISDMKTRLPATNVAFLFTALEEKGLLGARVFLRFAQEHNYEVNGVVCLDYVGRDGLALLTPSTHVGLKFRIPFWKEMLFDGQRVRSCPAYWPIDVSLIDPRKHGIELHRAALSRTDATAFIESGIPSVHLCSSDMWHCHHVWHTFDDTVEKLDENSLMRCLSVLKTYVNSLDSNR